jgi:protein-tyrosine phosphatase
LLEVGISAVVDLALNEPPAALPRDLAYCRFPLIDGPGNPRPLLRAAVETVACLLRSGTPTLVYCGAGMSRSPSVAGAAIALVKGLALAEGLDIALQSAPSDVSPGLWAEIHEALR